MVVVVVVVVIVGSGRGGSCSRLVIDGFVDLASDGLCVLGKEAAICWGRMVVNALVDGRAIISAIASSIAWGEKDTMV